SLRHQQRRTNRRDCRSTRKPRDHLERWHSDIPRQLSARRKQVAYAINDAGQVVGVSTAPCPRAQLSGITAYQPTSGPWAEHKAMQMPSTTQDKWSDGAIPQQTSVLHMPQSGMAALRPTLAH